LEQPISSQLLTAFCSFVGGLLFGVLYDALKALRLRAKREVLTAICDILASLFGFCILIFLFMGTGNGEARIYIAICAAAGSIIYFCLFSRVFLEIFASCLLAIAGFFGIVRKPFDILMNKLIKIVNILKKLFQKAGFCYTMRFIGKVHLGKESVKPPRNGRNNTNEVQKSKSRNKNRHSGDCRVCGNKSCVTEGSGFGRPGKTGHTANSGRRRSPKQH
jgi:spore cortex biosynthesis protein YabQ